LHTAVDDTASCVTLINEKRICWYENPGSLCKYV
jgi:hypothetical protein